MPPSKFGAGYTYGGDAKPPTPAYGQPPVLPVPQPVSPPPVSQPPVSGYGAPPAAMPIQPAYGAAATSYGTPPVVYGAPAGPSGATAIIAGVLALLMGLFRAWQTYGSFVGLASFGRYTSGLPGMGRIQAYLTIEAFASAAATLALIVGAVLLFNRKSAGRGFVTVGALIVIADSLLTWAAIYGWFDNTFSEFGGFSGGFEMHGFFVLMLLLNLGVPVLTMILALTGATRRWCQTATAGYVAPVTY